MNKFNLGIEVCTSDYELDHIDPVSYIKKDGIETDCLDLNPGIYKEKISVMLIGGCLNEYDYYNVIGYRIYDASKPDPLYSPMERIESPKVTYGYELPDNYN